MPDGWKFWLEWHRAVAPDNATEIRAIEADGGRFIGYVRAVGRRRGEAQLDEYCWPDPLRSFPQRYTRTPLLRTQDSSPLPITPESLFPGGPPCVTEIKPPSGGGHS